MSLLRGKTAGGVSEGCIVGTVFIDCCNSGTHRCSACTCCLLPSSCNLGSFILRTSDIGLVVVARGLLSEAYLPCGGTMWKLVCRESVRLLSSTASKNAADNAARFPQVLSKQRSYKQFTIAGFTMFLSLSWLLRFLDLAFLFFGPVKNVSPRFYYSFYFLPQKQTLPHSQIPMAMHTRSTRTTKRHKLCDSAALSVDFHNVISRGESVDEVA